MKLLKSKRSEGIPDSTRSTSLERLEHEIKAARVLITDDEVRAGKAKSSDKSTRILSRAVERVEEELMSSLSSFLKGRGWEKYSLIHGEIIIQRSTNFLNQNDELQSLTNNAKLSLRNFEDFRGWPFFPLPFLLVLRGFVFLAERTLFSPFLSSPWSLCIVCFPKRSPSPAGFFPLWGWLSSCDSALVFLGVSVFL